MPPQRYGTPNWRLANATTRPASRAGPRFGAAGTEATRAWAAGENRQASTTAVSGRRIRAYLGRAALHQKGNWSTSNEGAATAKPVLRLDLHRASIWSAQRLPSTVREFGRGGVFLWRQEP